MKNTRIITALAFSLFAYFFFTAESCTDVDIPQSASGVSAKTTAVKTDPGGWTIEQHNIANRLKIDNTPGAIKHLYVISPLSGEVIIYSTVKGKVTSSGKRLTPRTLGGGDGGYQSHMDISLNGSSYHTQEVIEDDGTYGSSVEYIYWWDAQGRYHQHFFTGGQIIHISDQPLPIHRVMIDVSAQ